MILRLRNFVGLALAGMLQLLAAPAPGQQEPVPAPRFDIIRFEVQGGTLLTAEQIERAMAPYTGKSKDFADIQRALEALEGAYRDAGWGVVQVVLPEQDITRGVIEFRVVEALLRKVVIEGNTVFSAENVRRSVPALREGATPNSREISRNLQVAAENPIKQTTVLMRSGEKEGEVDGVVKVTDARPWKASVTLDNTGTAQTGSYRVGLGYLHANVFDRDHVLTAQYITSPGHEDDVKIFGMGYRVPLYDRGASVDVIVGYSDVNSGTVQNLFTVSGSGTIFALRYNQHLPRLTDYEHKIVYGFDYRAYQNRVVIQGVGIVPDITVHPVSAYYSGVRRTSDSDFNFYLYAAQNVFPGGNDAGDSHFKATRVDAKAAYRVYRYYAAYTRVLGDWQIRGLLNGQYSRDALVPGEQFGVGGFDSVRGFLEREIANDRGYRASLEAYTPDLGAGLGAANAKVRLVAFWDTGTLKRNKAQPGEATRQSVSSAGFGVRLAAGKGFSMRLDFAQVLDGGGQGLDGGGGQGKNDQRVHASLSLVF